MMIINLKGIKLSSPFIKTFCFYFLYLFEIDYFLNKCPFFIKTLIGKKLSWKNRRRAVFPTNIFLKEMFYE